VDSRSGDGPITGRLADVLLGIAAFDDELTMYVPSGQPIGPNAIVTLLHEEIHDVPKGMVYFLEPRSVRDVLDAWRSWRHGKEPTPEEAVKAVAYYSEHDAFIPLSETDRRTSDHGDKSS